MATEPIRQYTDEIHRALGYWATWLPGSRLRLGDCGPVDGRRFDPQSSLSNFEIPFDVEDQSKPSDIQYVSDGAVTYMIQASGDNQSISNIPQGKAGIKLSFSRENAIVLVAKETRERRIADIRGLSQTLYDRISLGEFPPDHAVVTDVVQARAASIIISSSGGAELSVSADADLKAGLLDLATASLGLSRVSSSKLQTEIIAEASLTPLFKLVGLKREGRFIWAKEDVRRLGFEDLDGDAVEVGEIEPADGDP